MPCQEILLKNVWGTYVIKVRLRETQTNYIMKKAILILMLICATCAYGQRLSVLGIEMGTDIETAEKVLNERYGEYKVFRTGNTELRVFDARVGGSEFRSVSFIFQCARYGNAMYTYLSEVDLQKNFHKHSDAKSMFNVWEIKLGDKYTFDKIKEYENDSGTANDIYVYYKEGVSLSLSYGTSKGGELFWYVDVYYYENIINESNDY